MPEIILQSSHLVEELFVDHNKLQESALKALTDFKKLRVLRIAANCFKKFPDQIMDVLNLTVLDISKNEIERLPDSIFKMEKWVQKRIARIQVRLQTLLGSLRGFCKNCRRASATIFTFSASMISIHHKFPFFRKSERNEAYFSCLMTPL